jgi:hypothetical protein
MSSRTVHLSKVCAEMTLIIDELIIDELFYRAEDIDTMETLVLRNIQKQGYNAHKAGFLMRDCPLYLMQSWQRSWRAAVPGTEIQAVFAGAQAADVAGQLVVRVPAIAHPYW